MMNALITHRDCALQWRLRSWRRGVRRRPRAVGKMQRMSANKMPVGDLAKHVGEEIGVSSWILLDQTRINEFAHCTGDNQWIHLDAERAAREGPFGGTIAHGFLTLSLIAPTSFEVLLARISPKSVVNYGLEKVRFVAPVRSGKRVRNHIRIAAVEGKGTTRFLVTTENTIEIEGETKPALTASALAIFVA
jgi:acyl dehydratase